MSTKIHSTERKKMEGIGDDDESNIDFCVKKMKLMRRIPETDFFLVFFLVFHVSRSVDSHLS